MLGIDIDVKICTEPHVERHHVANFARGVQATALLILCTAQHYITNHGALEWKSPTTVILTVALNPTKSSYWPDWHLPDMVEAHVDVYTFAPPTLQHCSMAQSPEAIDVVLLSR